MTTEETMVHYVHSTEATNAVCGETARNIADNPRFTVQPGLITCPECRWRATATPTNALTDGSQLAALSNEALAVWLENEAVKLTHTPGTNNTQSALRQASKRLRPNKGETALADRMLGCLLIMVSSGIGFNWSYRTGSETDPVFLMEGTIDLSLIAQEMEKVALGTLLGSPITPALLDVVRERGTHAERGWTPEHDKAHGYRHLVHLSGKYSQQFFNWAPVYPHRPPGETDKARTYLVKAASLLLAAIELIDNAAPKGGPRG